MPADQVPGVEPPEPSAPEEELASAEPAPPVEDEAAEPEGSRPDPSESARPPAARRLVDPAPASDEAPPPRPAAEEAAPSRSRPLDVASLQVRRQPGLCNDPGDALEVHETLRQRFHHFDWGGQPLVYADPRLPGSAVLELIPMLEDAEKRAQSALRAEVPRPEVFAYFDTELLLAAACTNDDVVAYYDGALHVVPSHADVDQSVVHEYTHHVLMSRGIFGPTWAQEGIAMDVARERWWRRPDLLRRVLASPFSIDEMDRATPYTMRSDEAVSFYVQAAAMVACALRSEPDGVAGLVQSLFGVRPQQDAAYDLPEILAPRAMDGCVNSLLR